MPEKIIPLSPQEFSEKIKIAESSDLIDYLSHFQHFIDMAPFFATGPFCWFIPDNSKLKIVEVSPNIAQLTPYEADFWLNQGPDFFASLIHEDDRFYVMSSIQMAIVAAQKLRPEDRTLIRINIYGRLMNDKKKYRWALIQIPAFYLNSKNEVLSGLILITDMSHLNFTHGPMMTIIHIGKKQRQYFKVTNFKTTDSTDSVPMLTNRENEVLQLMVKGLNTPQIAEMMFLSYHTVENHKRNLRIKTNTKTSAELIDYVWRNNLI